MERLQVVLQPSNHKGINMESKYADLAFRFIDDIEVSEKLLKLQSAGQRKRTNTFMTYGFYRS